MSALVVGHVELLGVGGPAHDVSRSRSSANGTGMILFTRLRKRVAPDPVLAELGAHRLERLTAPPDEDDAERRRRRSDLAGDVRLVRARKRTAFAISTGCPKRRSGTA